MVSTLATLLVACLLVVTNAAYKRPNLQDCVTPAITPFEWLAPVSEGPFGLTTSDCTSGTCTYKVSVSELFTIDYMPNYKVLRNNYTAEVSVLYNCGMARPSAVVFEADLKAGNTVRYFQIPLTATVAADSTALAYLEALGVADRVAKVGEYSAVSPCMSKLAATTKETPLGCGHLYSDASSAAEFDSFLTYGFAATGAMANKTVSVTGYNDATALARAEWIGFVAAFYNKEGEAAKQFTAIKDAYTSLSRPVTDSSMKVLWVSYMADVTGYGYTDSAGKAITGAVYAVSFAPYKLDLSESAGLSILPAKEEWMMAADKSVKAVGFNSHTAEFSVVVAGGDAAGLAKVMSVIKPLLKKADYVIDETYLFSDPTAGLQVSFMKDWGISTTESAMYPFLKNGQLWRHDKARGPTNSDDWFGQGISRPDLVLADLVNIVDPAASPDHVNRFFRNAKLNEAAVTQTYAECTTEQLTCTSFENQVAITPDGVLGLISSPPSPVEPVADLPPIAPTTAEPTTNEVPPPKPAASSAYSTVLRIVALVPFLALL